MTAPALPEPSQPSPSPETEQPALIVIGSDDAPTCTDGACAW
ncbi:hypothetical protein [Amycolatopsis sp. lyj-112]